MASYRKRNGTWEYRISYKDVYSGQYKQKSHGGYVRKSDAQEAANKVQSAMFDGFIEKNDNPTFASYAKTWLALKKPQWRNNTYFSKTQSYRRVSGQIGHIPIKQLNATVVQQYLNSLDHQDYSWTTGKNDYVFINQVVKKAQEDGYIYRYPLQGVQVPMEHTKRTSRFWTKEQFEQYAKCERNRITMLKKRSYFPRYYLAVRNYAIICVLAGCGLRIGELCGLTTSCYHADSLLIEVKYNYVKATEDSAHSKFERTELLKTEASHRTIPVSEISQKALDQWLSVRDDYLDIFKLNPDNETMFPTSWNGLPMMPTTVAENFITSCNRYDMPVINLHALRHTYASFLSAAGVTAKEAQSLLGHKSFYTTMNIYTHITDNGKRDAVDRLNSFMHKKSPDPTESDDIKDSEK